MFSCQECKNVFKKFNPDKDVRIQILNHVYFVCNKCAKEQGLI